MSPLSTLIKFALTPLCFLALIYAGYAYLAGVFNGLEDEEHEMWEDLEVIDLEKQLQERKVDVI